MDIQSKSEIVAHLEEKFNVLIEWTRAQPDAAFDKGPEGKWTMGQQIAHLITSAEQLNQGLRIPKIGLKGMFGTNNREERSYDAVVARYKEKLALGGKAPKKYEPEPVPVSKKGELLGKLEKEGKRLQKAMDKWSEDQLSKFLLPHPLMGKLTVREMMLFTVYHMVLHGELLKRDAGIVE